MQTCETCRFWQENDPPEAERGLCRRHAPKPRTLFIGPEMHAAKVEDDEDHPYVWWPDTFAQEFCGEWQERKEAT